MPIRGTTSACAENTRFDRPPAGFDRNYLRVRGEYRGGFLVVGNRMELPPRARRIHVDRGTGHGYRGTTSACAENTQEFLIEAAATRNYLRVRGEYSKSLLYKSALSELPPRARRIHIFVRTAVEIRGTTSACAENTKEGREFDGVLGNYLRVRGEYSSSPVFPRNPTELPPRARRILANETASLPNAGTTSACAENTTTNADHKTTPRNYLRVRGEYFGHHARCPLRGELPPRARRIPIGNVIQKVRERTTSACAENTPRPEPQD